ncbi:hypothetical protein D3C80_1881340 [compost metagenome]
MERTLAARQRVRVFWVENKAAATVLQADAGIRHNHARAKAHKVRLNKGDHHTARIGRGKVNRPALRRRTVGEI